jgi:hypothetical protein
VINVSLSFTGDGFQGLLDQSEPAALDTSLEDYAKANGASRRMATIGGDLGSVTLGPGTYNAASAMYLTGKLILDAQAGANPDPSDPEWIFNINGAFTIAAGSTIVFANMPNGETVSPGVPHSHVKWVVEGAISIGASARLSGSMHAIAGSSTVVGATATVGPLKAENAITVGATAKVYGPIEAIGDVTVGAVAWVYGQIRAVNGAITIAAAPSCGLCAEGAITFTIVATAMHSVSVSDGFDCHFNDQIFDPEFDPSCTNQHGTYVHPVDTAVATPPPSLTQVEQDIATAEGVAVAAFAAWIGRSVSDPGTVFFNAVNIWAGLLSAAGRSNAEVAGSIATIFVGA